MDETQIEMNRKLWSEVKDRGFTQPMGDAKQVRDLEWHTDNPVQGPVLKDPDGFILWWVKFCYNWFGRVGVLALLEKNPAWATEIKQTMVILPSDDGQNL